MLLKLKTAAAILLIASLCLPLSRCNDVDASGKNYDPPRYTYRYALSDFSPGDPGSWLLLSAYLWPLCSLAVQWRHRKTRTWLSIFEMLFCVGSAYVIHFAATLLNEIWIGGWMALFALTAYFVLAAASFRAGRASHSPARILTAAPGQGRQAREQTKKK